MKKYGLLILLFSFSINGCTSLKRLKTVTQGIIVQQNYIEEIPFKFIDGQIYVQVEINDKFYPFIFDTGNDLTSIDLSLIDEIDFSSNSVNNKITDASNISRINDYLSLKKLSIGGIEFENIGAQTTDFSHYKQVNACKPFVGIIGNNLMRKAKWEINYQDETLKITDNIKKLNIPEDASKFKTDSGNYGSADIKIAINGFKDKYTIDTGFSGFMCAGMNLFEKIILKDNIRYTSRTGINSISAHGFTKTTNYKVRIKNIELGSTEISDQIVDFETGQSKLLGNEFLKHFIIRIEWDEELIYLEKKIKLEKPEINTHQVIFHPNYLTNKIEIYGYWDDNALEKSIELGSEFLSINGIDVSNFNTSELCGFW
ncbi:retropepsin-like aspartic protease, partial [Autumnicola edwardsiae]